MALLVIDVGSSSARAMLFDRSANPIPGAIASRAYQFTSAQPGESTIDAEYLRQTVETCIDEILEHPQAKAVEAVGMATFVGNLLGVSERAITPIYTYADTRSAADVAALAPQIGADGDASPHQRTGCPHHTAYHPARITWLRRTQPDLFSRVEVWMDFAAYLYREWFGVGVCSYSVASWSGLINRTTLDWDDEWLRILDLSRAALPPLADYDAMQRGLTPPYARLWPALRDTPFCLAVGDGAAANVGSGCVDETRMALTVGTTSALRVITTTALQPIPSGLWSYRVDAARHLVGGALTEGGNVYQWATATLRLDENLEAALLQREPDQHGLTVLPLLAGERSPGWATHATGAILGLRLSTSPLDILQAILESVALRLALIAGQLAPALKREADVVGGGKALTTSPVWAQMIASALDRPLNLALEGEITGRGVAILALCTLKSGRLSDYSPAVASTVYPQPRQVAALKAARERQERLYKLLLEHMQ